MNLKYILLIKIILMFSLFLTVIACEQKSNQPSLNEEYKKQEASQKIETNIIAPITVDNQQIVSDIVPPQNIQCVILDLDEQIIQVEATWDNNIEPYNGIALRGYQYVWIIYGQNIVGFLDAELQEEFFVGTSITFNKQETDSQIKILVRNDYGDIVGEYTDKICIL